MATDDEILDRLFRALGDVTRRRIVEELGRRDGQSLFELYTRIVTHYGVGQTRQGFSRHLVTLERAGLIAVEWQGTTKLHRLETAPLARLIKSGWLAPFQENSK